MEQSPSHMAGPPFTDGGDPPPVVPPPRGMRMATSVSNPSFGPPKQDSGGKVCGHTLQIT